MKSMRSIQISLTLLSLCRFALVGIVGLSLSSAVAADRTVTFKDDDGTVIWTESIKEGECAFPPSDPVKFGCDFAGWSDGSQVKSYVEIDRLPVTAAKTWTATYVPHEGRRLRAVIYSGPGANGGACLNYHRLFRNNPRIEYKHYHSDRIRTESGLLNTADMLLIPGGTTAGMWSSLDTAGRKAIADFVQKEGGRYFGTCAGTAFQMNDGEPHMGLAPFKNTSQTYHDAVTVTLTEKGQEIFGALDWDGSVDNRIYYSNSPIMSDSKAGFKAGTYHFDVLATYKSGLASGYTGKYAMVVGTNYLGRLFLTAPHPEVYEESRKFITTGVRWLFNEGVARNGATAEELKAASTGLTFTLPTTGKNPRALKVAYGPAAFTDVGAEQLLELMHAIDQHHDYVLTPKTGDNITAGQLLDEGFDVLVVPKYKEMYTSDAVTAFKSAGGKVFYEASVGADGVMRGLRATMAAQPVPMEDHEDWGWRYPLLGIDQNEEALAFTKTGEDMAWTVPAGVTAIECLVVGGGGGGGRSYAGGGGAGGLIHSDSLAVMPGSTLTIRVGAGGAGGISGSANGKPGETSRVTGPGVALEALGGGGGGTAKKSGTEGGSGGGSGGHGNSTGDAGKGVVYAGGAATVAGQGFAGGSVKDFNGTGGAGGGGAGGAGTGCAESGVYAGRAGGAGVKLDITGASIGYAGGGGGGGGYASTAPSGGSATCGGGAGGVGVKGATTGGTGKAGKAGTGGGGGGGGRVADGGAGGSGIVIIRYTLDPNAHRHTYGEPVTVLEPTCTEDGYTVETCTDCVDVPPAARTNLIDALGHKWGKWETITEATETDEGLKRRTCLREGCDGFEEEAIPVIYPDDPDDPYPDVEYVGPGQANAFPVTFTFDDCFKSHRETVAPLFKKYGWPAMFNLCLNHIADSGKAGTNQMSWAEIREIRDLSGDFAFAAHSITHGHLENMSAAKYTEEIVTSRDRIITELGVTPTYFCHPYTASSPAEERAIRAAGMKPMSLNRHAMRAEAAPGQYYSVKNMIERELAKAARQPMDILFHGIDPKWGGTEAMQHEGDFVNMMAEVAELVKAGTVRIVTYDEFYAKIPPSLDQRAAEPVQNAVVPTHRPQLKAFIAKSAAERSAAMSDAATRAALADEGTSPRPAAFTWFGDGEIAFTLKQGSKTVFTTNLVGNALEVGNLEVNQTYTWTVANANGSASGTFKTEDESPRLVKDETTGVALRELGGAMGMDAKRIKRQLVFQATGADFGDGLVGAVTKVAVPDGFPTYGDIFTDAGKAQVKTLLETVMNPDSFPVAFYSTNDDRAATVAFILGALLGVDADLLTLDWQLLALRNASTEVTMATLDPLVNGFAAYDGATLPEQVASYVESAGVPFATVAAFRNAMLEGGWAAPMVGPAPVARDYAVEPMVNAGWGYQIVGLGKDANEVALVFTNTTGVLSWFVPEGVTSVRYCLVGGGGAGGSVSSDSGYSGYGGNGGAVVESEVELTSPELSVLVGKGGLKTADTYGKGGSGVASTLTANGSTVLTASGGEGGDGAKTHKNAGKGGDGAGGVGSAGDGSKGGAGGPGVRLTIIDDERLYGAGGGGGATGTSSAAGGAGGTTGGGAGGKGVNSGSSAGSAGTFYGAGGGGSGGMGYTKGGNGYQGVVIVRYGCTEIPEKPVENRWTAEPSIEPTSFEEGTMPSLNLGSAAYGTPKANYTAAEIATFAAGEYTLIVTVAATAEYKGLEMQIPFTVTAKTTPPAPPTPTDEVTTNAMANASWGYTISGLGDDHRDVALVFTNAADDASMNWTVPDGVTSIQYLVIGGGGAGGSGYAGSTRSNSYPDMGGGGGGAGAGFEGTAAVSANDEIPVVVGVGGVGAVSAQGGDGGESSLTVAGQKIAAAGGGGGGRAVNSSTLDASLAAGRDGGCGGGGTVRCKVTNTTADKTIQAVGASLDENRGKAGGRGYIYISGSSSQLCYGGGGGGITEAGHVAGGGTGNRFGGAGLASSITGEEVVYGGGGGGGGATGTDGGAGGAGGGGKGGDKNTVTSTRGCGYPGTDGLGGGGGGGTGYSAATDKSISFAGGNGGSGVVIIRYTAPQGEDPKEGWSEDPAQDEGKAASEVYPQLATSSVLGSVDAGTLGKWAKAKSVNFTEFMDAPGSFEDAFLLDCAVSEVEDKKAKFRFAEIVPGVTPTIGEGGRYGNGKVVVYGMAELGAGGEWEPADDDSRFFKAKLVPVRYDENLSDRIGDLQGGGV